MDRGGAEVGEAKDAACDCMCFNEAAPDENIKMTIEKGRRFGRLVVQAEEGSKGGKTEYLCQCDCGKFKKVRGTKLTQGRETSCGCGKADPVVRQAARFQTAPERRSEIAKMGAEASKAKS